MFYSELYAKNSPRIPTPLALILVLFISLFFVRVFSNSPTPSRANKLALKRLEITNNFPGQVTVFWQTDSREKGWIVYGDNKISTNSIAFDDRDLQETKGTYLNHYITLKNLESGKRYYFKIVRDENSVLTNATGEPFSFMTPLKDTNTKNLQLAYGKIVKQDGQPLENAIVLLSVNSKYLLSTQTKTKGDWLIPINTDIFDPEGKKIPTLTSKDVFIIQIISEDNKISTIKTNLANVRPLPQTVLIGNDYQFLHEESEVLSASSFRIQGEKKVFDILFPKENAVIPGKSPLIKGIALPNADIVILVDSKKTISNKIKTDTDGYWKLTLGENLVPGLYTVTMVAQDEQRKEIKIQRKFAIAKSGEQVLGEATNEPTIITPLPTSTIVPTTPPPPPPITLTPTQPVSGSSFNGFIVTGTSLLILGAGLLLAF